MKNSTSKLELIRPAGLNREEGINAWFSLKNAETINAEGEIQGLNLGLNTSQSRGRVEKNRRELFAELGLDAEWVAFGNQVHSNRVRMVTQGGVYPETDALVTAVPGLALAIQVADCAAVLLADPVNRIIGAVHAGWRGAAGGILPAAVHLMQKNGAVPSQMHAFVSPCISLKNFEVGAEVADQFPDGFVDWNTFSKPHVDLKGFLHSQMIHSGIDPGRIEVHEDCTIEEEQRYYSYRREKDRSGRMIGLVVSFEL